LAAGNLKFGRLEDIYPADVLQGKGAPERTLDFVII
jgi:hypothetical protein